MTCTSHTGDVDNIRCLIESGDVELTVKEARINKQFTYYIRRSNHFGFFVSVKEADGKQYVGIIDYGRLLRPPHIVRELESASVTLLRHLLSCVYIDERIHEHLAVTCEVGFGQMPPDLEREG